jgi:hypothetical protein
LTSSKTKSLYATKGLEDDVAKKIKDPDYSIDLKGALTPIYEETMVKSAQHASSLLPFGVSLEDTPEWTTWLENRAGQIAEDINAETQKQVLASIKQGLDKGETIDQLRVRIEDVMGSKSSVRATRIARTEAKRASSQADLYVWDSSGVVIGKEWFASSGHPCPQCQSMDRKIIGLKENFFDKGDIHTFEIVTKAGETKQQSVKLDYEDVVAPPLHVQCQCVLLPVIANF